MARLDLRLRDEEKAQLQADADAQGKTLSKLVRERLFDSQDAGDRLDDLERRLTRLEELAGL